METSAIILRCLAVTAFTLFLAACSETNPSPSATEQPAGEYLEASIKADALMGTYSAIEGARHDELPGNSLAGRQSIL